ncbi:lysophospholipid acyltransferase family protein [Falsihalocynthiibacter sp. SS001]|uniref:lysophospholipid acyltransferase family protein n=1 Tax=Falsihalocynthiibacter sp. SS001 TaxID=3349698 RepID=UPI0036D35678
MAKKKQSLGKRIANSRFVTRLVAKTLANYVRFVWSTTHWTSEGFDEMREALKDGPIIVVLWHQRLLMAPYLFDLSAGRICSLTSTAKGGRMAGMVQQEFGFETIPMPKGQGGFAMSREVLRKMKDGVSVGIAVDGTNGPARVAKTAPLLWARSSGRPVFVAAFATKRHSIMASSWDQAMLAWPFNKGVRVCQRWEHEVPRKVSDDELESLRQKLEASLDEVTERVDNILEIDVPRTKRED